MAREHGSSTEDPGGSRPGGRPGRSWTKGKTPGRRQPPDVPGTVRRPLGELRRPGPGPVRTDVHRPGVGAARGRQGVAVGESRRPRTVVGNKTRGLYAPPPEIEEDLRDEEFRASWTQPVGVVQRDKGGTMPVAQSADAGHLIRSRRSGGGSAVPPGGRYQTAKYAGEGFSEGPTATSSGRWDQGQQ